MRRSWVIERRRILALVATILILGTLSSYWAISILLPVIVYIGWQLVQFYRLEEWLLRGFKPRDVPQSSGVWESIISQILVIRKKDKALQKRLTKTAKGYRNTVKALPDATIVVNHNLEIEWSNQIAERYLGINAKRDLGYRITNLIRDPSFVEYLAKPGSKALEFVAPNHHDMTLSIRVIQYGQDQRLILGRDISERIQMRNALRAFISNASHELRTPLTVTSGYIDLIQDDPSLPNHMREPVEQLREQSRHMTQLINDLLVLSQLEGDTLAEYEGRSVNVPSLLSQLIENMNNSGISREHRIELEINQALGVRGVKHEILSICSNLVENAIKYTPPQTLITVNWDSNEKGQPCFKVRDNGPGFGTEHIPHLTQRFYRIDNQQTLPDEGTGLGLAIVKHAVMHHGGWLDISSQPDEGAEFTVCFPKSRAVTLNI